MVKTYCRGKNFIFHNIRQTDETVGFQDGKNAHNTCDHCSEDRCQRRAMYAESRKTKVSINQQKIENNVDRIGGYIGAHGDFGVAGSPLGGVNAHLNAVKNHAAHNDTEVCYCAVMGFRSGAA